MSFKIKLNNITVPSGNQFKVFYKLDSRTPGSVASQGDNAWGTLYGTYTGGTTTNIEIDFLPITSNPYGKQHWFKILDTVTGSYIIENIYIHEYEYYTACLSTPTPTPTSTSTPTPTPTPTPTATNTPIPTDTPTPTPTPEVTNTPTPTPTPEPTNTPTPTPTTLCDAPTLSGVTLSSGSVFTLNYGTPTNCTALTLSFSRDQVTWTNSTGGCTTGRQVDTLDATGTWYFRLTQICSVGEGNSNVVSYTYTTPIPTPTPTATATPTPTPTQITGSGCVTFSQSDSYSQINCLNQGPYNVTTTRVTATLDAIAPLNVIVRIFATRYPCYGVSQPDQYDVTITAGQISNYIDLTTLSYVDCGQESTCQIETISIDSYSVLTQGYSLCITPTPTSTPIPTSTPEPEITLEPTNPPFAYYCNYGQGCIGQLEPCPNNAIDCGFGFAAPN